MQSNTPYDDVHRTMANDCPQLLIPVVNEAFQESYTGEEKVVLGNAIHFLEQQDAEEDKRITDSYFTIHGKDKTGKYHIESQCEDDNSMLIRMFEYDTQIALENAELTKERLVVELPKAAVIYLRSTKNTPDILQTTIKTPGGDITYDIPALKLKSYTIEELFEKKLVFLIPFHIFVYENSFLEYNNSEDKLLELQKIYEHIKNRLSELSAAGEINEYTRHCIMDMSRKVLEHIAAKHERVKKGIGDVMGGKILTYEAKDIYNAGKKAGISEGRSEGRLELGLSLLKKGIITLAEAANCLGMAEEEVKLHM